MQFTPEQTELLLLLTTPMISDAMDRLGIESGVLPRTIQPMSSAASVKCFGFAFPCRVRPTKEYIEIHKLLEMVDAVPADSIVCVAADDDIDAALWGGLMSARAKARGARGAIVNGGVRDIEQIAELGFPVFGEYRCVKDIRRRGFMADYNVPIQFGEVHIRPGDVLFGDANGVVRIRKEGFVNLISELRKVREGETRTASGLSEGESAAELFSRFEIF